MCSITRAVLIILAIFVGGHGLGLEQTQPARAPIWLFAAFMLLVMALLFGIDGVLAAMKKTAVHQPGVIAALAASSNPLSITLAGVVVWQVYQTEFKAALYWYLGFEGWWLLCFFFALSCLRKIEQGEYRLNGLCMQSGGEEAPEPGLVKLISKAVTLHEHRVGS